MSATSGPTSPRQFAYFDPDESCWRTWPAISLWGSETYSGTWPKRGTTRNGACFEHPTWEPPTAVPASGSLLRTPIATRSGPRTGIKLTGRQATDPQVGLVDQVVSLMPTPTARDWKGGLMPECEEELHRPRGEGGKSDLASAAMWLGREG